MEKSSDLGSFAQMLHGLGQRVSINIDNLLNTNLTTILSKTLHISWTS